MHASQRLQLAIWSSKLWPDEHIIYEQGGEKAILQDDAMWSAAAVSVACVTLQLALTISQRRQNEKSGVQTRMRCLPTGPIPMLALSN